MEGQDYQKQSHCLGCRLANATQPVHIVYENEWVTCLLDIEPFNEGHTLILPKHHYEEWTDVDPLMMEQITKAAHRAETRLSNTRALLIQALKEARYT